MVGAIKKGGLKKSAFQVIDVVFAHVGLPLYQSPIDFVSAQVGSFLLDESDFIDEYDWCGNASLVRF